MKKAYKTSWNGIDSIYAAESASKARYLTYLSARDAGYRACRIFEVRAVRAPRHDAWAAVDSTKRGWHEEDLPCSAAERTTI